MKAIAAAAVLATLISPVANATQWYVGIGAGQARSDIFPPGLGDFTIYDRKDGAYSLKLGARLTPHLAVEAGYFDFGRFSVYAHSGASFTGGIGSSTLEASARARTLGLSLVALAPIDPWEIYGRIGYARSEVETRSSLLFPPGPALDERTRSRANEAFGGVGLRWKAAPHWALFAEYQKHDKLEIDAWFAGVEWRF